MLGTAELVAFVASSDLERSGAFYRDVLGLTPVEQNDFAHVFDAHGTMLRVTAVPEVVRAGYTVLGWQVADLRESVRGLKAAGVAFHRYEGMGQDEDDVWATPGGDLVAWFADPDGHTLSLTQFAARG
ncbi:MAG TPA: VOC family protein [Actinocrinis sp.]|nr:VOC family protein [Actinocrinis sp.]